MNICVLLKQTFDTEEKVVLRDGAVSEDGVKFVINPYDEYAVEEAILLRDKAGGTIVVVSVGPERTAEALRTALAMGADEAVLIANERIGGDEHAVSKALASYIGRHSFDVVLGGNFSVDNGAGQVAVRVAELLGMPHVSSVTKLTVDGASATALRDAEGDTETVEVRLPAVFTAQQGLNEPRYPSLPGIMKAKKKPFAQLTLDDLGLSEAELEPRTAREQLSLPPQRQAGRLLKGSAAEQAAELVHLLRTESKVI
ncbi:electron transfer flavoprotein subunit beta/FixA family protein [Cohnella lubricantis]|uniref:Electron transfer flavoprotein subunit beta n=1 Tax=Cohnella lubricantis TaxID=2163172 RepID=A0A841TAZ7_9BACL|nr:electron transfer flavoprotein subunit beta/FixA family protein [Cohnella lubricantis]MBB6678172.1 electron transfer flavoprotein subunit beta/FixA family protein [Cohnella lubricantis]MBP2119702.1 electron transfer flavoprotein beta subunit [Cohnella lubricantis]